MPRIADYLDRAINVRTEALDDVPTTRHAWIRIAEKLCLILIAVSIARLFYSLVTVEGSVRVAEHSALEIVQILLLVTAFGLFLAARHRSAGVDRVVATVCAILMGTGVLREIDVKTWNGPSWWNFLTNHGLQEVLLVGGGLLALGYLIVNRSHLPAILARATTPFSWPFNLAVAVTFVGAYLLERRLKFIPNAQLIEEYAEFAGYVLFIVAALRTLELSLSHAARVRRPASSP